MATSLHYVGWRGIVLDDVGRKFESHSLRHCLLAWQIHANATTSEESASAVDWTVCHRDGGPVLGDLVAAAGAAHVRIEARVCPGGVVNAALL